MSEPFDLNPKYIQSENQARDDFDEVQRSLPTFQPHRGKKIITFGTIGLLLFLMCGIVGMYFSLKALYMANDDLELLEKEKIDPDAARTLQSGQILAGIGVFLNFITGCGSIALLVFGGLGLIVASVK